MTKESRTEEKMMKLLVTVPRLVVVRGNDTQVGREVCWKNWMKWTSCSRGWRWEKCTAEGAE
jgi:hypothetical protein